MVGPTWGGVIALLLGIELEIINAEGDADDDGVGVNRATASTVSESVR